MKVGLEGLGEMRYLMAFAAEKRRRKGRWSGGGCDGLYHRAFWWTRVKGLEHVDMS